MLLRRICFDPDVAGGGASDGAPAVETPAAGAAPAKVEAPKPDAEVDAMRKRLAEFEKAEAKRAADAKTAAEAEALKRGEHEKIIATERAEREKLAAELEGYRAKETARLDKVNAKNGERVQKIPEDRRSLVPSVLSGDDLDEYLTANWKHLVGEEPKPAGGPRPKPTPAVDERVPDAIVAEAKLRAMDPVAFLALVKKFPRQFPALAKHLPSSGAN